MEPVTFDGANFAAIAAAAGDSYEGPAAMVRDADGELQAMRPGWVAVPLAGGGVSLYSARAWARRQAGAA